MSTPALKAATATARYIAPVSKCGRSSSAAKRRATVDLPEPAGPSIAITVAISDRSCALGRRSSRQSKNSGKVLFTQSGSRISIRGTRSPSRDMDMAIRWSSYVLIVAPLKSHLLGRISRPSGFSIISTPHLESSAVIAASRSVSFARMKPMPLISTSESANAATAANVCAVSEKSCKSKLPPLMRSPSTSMYPSPQVTFAPSSSRTLTN